MLFHFVLLFSFIITYNFNFVKPFYHARALQGRRPVDALAILDLPASLQGNGLYSSAMTLISFASFGVLDFKVVGHFYSPLSQRIQHR
jgi:hypothetical protein